MVEDFSYECTDFPTFGLKPKEMTAKIKEILNKIDYDENIIKMVVEKIMVIIFSLTNVT